jgi:hypothetical protein
MTDIENVPLQDLCKDAERLTRELIDHLERNMIPRTKEFQSLVRPDSAFDTGSHVQDITIRNQAKTLQESQEFTEQLYQKTSQYLDAIDREVGRLTGN